MGKLSIFVVDDIRIFRLTLSDELRDAGYEVYEFANGQAALMQIPEIKPDVIISDIKMPIMDGQELLNRVKTQFEDIFFILMTAHASIDSAVKAMKEGAYDYLVKPFETEHLLMMLERLIEFKKLKTENIALKKNIFEKYNFSTFVGNSPEVKNVFKLVEKVMDSNTTILIKGETGTGKELLTNVIHYNSNRKDKPFVKVSCAILSKEIFESELFGHVKGAFTGADETKIGRFELADTGTLYLDDIDDIPLNLQVKLLRVLEEGEIEKLGSPKTIKVDVRIIASTKVDLKELVQQGKFRQDLFYRLNVYPIKLPPLRERTGDVKVLIDYFAKKYSKNNLKIEPEVYKILSSYEFPGNVRELKNLIERLVLLAENNTIKAQTIPFEIRNPSVTDKIKFSETASLNEQIKELEIYAIKNALEKAGNNKSKAAELLDLPLSTLRSKMEKYGIN